MTKLLMGAAALAMLAALPQGALAQDAMATPGKARQHGPAAEIPWHSAVRPGAQGR